MFLFITLSLGSLFSLVYFVLFAVLVSLEEDEEDIFDDKCFFLSLSLWRQNFAELLQLFLLLHLELIIFASEKKLSNEFIDSETTKSFFSLALFFLYLTLFAFFQFEVIFKKNRFFLIFVLNCV